MRIFIAFRLSQALGPISREQGSTLVWSVRPADGRSPINVRLNIDANVPTVWVFDPRRRDGGVTQHKVRQEEEVAGIIAAILTQAGREAPPSEP